MQALGRRVEKVARQSIQTGEKSCLLANVQKTRALVKVAHENLKVLFLVWSAQRELKKVKTAMCEVRRGGWIPNYS